MKIALFDDYIPGLVGGNTITDLSDAVGATVMREQPRDRMLALIERFDALRPRIMQAVGPQHPLSSVRLRAPVPRPSKMLFAQGNYFENTDTPMLPLNMFFKAPSSVLDPGGTVRLISQDAFIFQHEAEFAAIIGIGGRNIPQGEALSHIFGYSCLIDVSARGLGRGLDLIDKSADTFCPLGPWIATRDEIENPQNLRVTLSVDGQLRQDYNTDDMEHPVAKLVAWASQVLTLEPGDVIGCGTNHQGLGPLQDGETATIEIEKVGAMSVRIEDPLKRRWPVGVDPGIGRAVIKMRTTGALPDPAEAFPTRRIT
jgi:2-keto-4-pentenoate hydratase/2-oxohepta-3-ene-1,7-dioic acid hydratase in catechol pathway